MILNSDQNIVLQVLCLTEVFKFPLFSWYVEISGNYGILVGVNKTFLG